MIATFDISTLLLLLESIQMVKKTVTKLLDKHLSKVRGFCVLVFFDPQVLPSP